uniref:uncharacterized protein n=1 Tax=Myxine glutinosa TaxID=7769 RepID=UPI00358FCF36
MAGVSRQPRTDLVAESAKTGPAPCPCCGYTPTKPPFLSKTLPYSRVPAGVSSPPSKPPFLSKTLPYSRVPAGVSSPPSKPPFLSKTLPYSRVPAGVSSPPCMDFFVLECTPNKSIVPSAIVRSVHYTGPTERNQPSHPPPLPPDTNDRVSRGSVLPKLVPANEVNLALCVIKVQGYRGRSRLRLTWPTVASAAGSMAPSGLRDLPP